MATSRAVISRSCSFDSSFEQIYIPENWKVTDPEIVNGRGKHDEPLSRENFDKLLDADGRLVSEHNFRKAVFRGGIKADVRKDAWKFLFGYYPFQSTRREREVICLESRCRYKALKARWKAMESVLCPRSTKPKQTTESQSLSSNRNEHQLQDNNSLVDSYNGNDDCLERATSLSDETQQQMQFIEFQAKIFAERQRLDTDNLVSLQKSLRTIDKDVPRTDRDLPFFKGAQNPNLTRLRDILMTFAVFHPKRIEGATLMLTGKELHVRGPVTENALSPMEWLEIEVTYAQGMNDVLSRFLVVMEDEVDAYWCFTLFMENIFNDFLEDGMLKKLTLVRQLVEEVDSALVRHLESCDVGDLTFLHRWLLLCFKREFPFNECLTIFEIVSSQYMELSSVETERIRDEERAKDFQRAGGGQRTSMEVINPEFTFELFVCAAILQDHREKLLECEDSAAVFQFVMNGLAHKLNLYEVLSQAEQLLLAYCRKKVVTDSFELVD